MSQDETELFNELNDFSKELIEDESYYGYPYNKHNPRFNLNLVSSDSIDELIRDVTQLLYSAVEYKEQGWELTEPIKFGKIQLHHKQDEGP